MRIEKTIVLTIHTTQSCSMYSLTLLDNKNKCLHLSDQTQTKEKGRKRGHNIIYKTNKINNMIPKLFLEKIISLINFETDKNGT